MGEFGGGEAGCNRRGVRGVVLDETLMLRSRHMCKKDLRRMMRGAAAIVQRVQYHSKL